MQETEGQTVFACEMGVRHRASDWRGGVLAAVRVPFTGFGCDYEYEHEQEHDGLPV